MSHARQPRRGRALAIASSVVFHVAGAGALVVASFWTIDPLPRPELAVVAAARLPAAAPAGAAEPAARRVEPPRRRVRDTVQPRQELAADEPSAGGTGTGTGTGMGMGMGMGTGMGTGVTGLCADPTSCLGDVGTIPVTPPPSAPEIVPAKLVEGSRIAGDPRIAPPEPVRAAMLRRGESRLRATIKMCLDRRGHVDTLAVLASSGHAAYDRELLSGMRSWRYEPYRVRGAAVPVCTAVTFVYEMR